MGLQQLLLAITVLIAGKLATLVLPISESSDFGASRNPSAELTQPVSPSPANDRRDRPFRDAEPERFSINSKGGNEQSMPALTAEDGANPVQGWAEEETVVGATAPLQGRTEDAAIACRSVSSAVVTVRAGREIGSGSIMSSNGLVITNHHVVRRLNDQSLTVMAEDGNRYSGQVVANDRRHDLALIQLEAQNGSFPTVRLAAMNSPTVGQSVCAIGSPFGEAGKITAGTLVKILPNGDLQSTVTLKPGNSGGPLINAQGEMIGVNKGVARGRGEDDRISYATSSAVASSFIQQSQRSAATPDTWQR